MSLRERFGAVLARVAQGASPGEVLAGWLRAERSDFVRFNHSQLRQAGTVERASLELRLMASGRQARHTLTLSGERSTDESRVGEAIARLRDAVAVAQHDPFLRGPFGQLVEVRVNFGMVAQAQCDLRQFRANAA